MTIGKQFNPALSPKGKYLACEVHNGPIQSHYNPCSQRLPGTGKDTLYTNSQASQEQRKGSTVCSATWTAVLFVYW